MSTFFFNDTATTEIYTLSLHDALPICVGEGDVYIHTRAYAYLAFKDSILPLSSGFL